MYGFECGNCVVMGYMFVGVVKLGVSFVGDFGNEGCWINVV